MGRGGVGAANNCVHSIIIFLRNPRYIDSRAIKVSTPVPIVVVWIAGLSRLGETCHVARVVRGASCRRRSRDTGILATSLNFSFR